MPAVIADHLLNDFDQWHALFKESPPPATGTWRVLRDTGDPNRVYVIGEIADADVGKTLTLNLKYGPSRERSLAGVKRVSKPGLRVYAKSTHLPRVLGGLGVAILSTSSGLLTDREADKKGVGGEVVAFVW